MQTWVVVQSDGGVLSCVSGGWGSWVVSWVDGRILGYFPDGWGSWVESRVDGGPGLSPGWMG